MGFRKQPTHYKLTFDDPELEGFEVVARALPLADFLEINRLVAQVNSDPTKESEANEATVKKFSDALVSWNLEDEDGKPIPADHDGLLTQEVSFVLTIIQSWMGALAGVPKASNAQLNGGGTSLEQSIQMEVS